MTQYISQRAMCEDLDPKRLVDVVVVQRDEQHSHRLFHAGPGIKMLGAEEEKKESNATSEVTKESQE